MTTKAPDLQAVTQRVWPPRRPAPVEVELWRAEALAVRRGLSAARAERWSDVRSQAHPRWLGPALAPHRGTVLAYVCGRRKETVCLARPAL
jgi:hypothetical protein